MLILTKVEGKVKGREGRERIGGRGRRSNNCYLPTMQNASSVDTGCLEDRWLKKGKPTRCSEKGKRREVRGCENKVKRFGKVRSNNLGVALRACNSRLLLFRCQCQSRTVGE
jgi:hypothetical protein